MNFFKGIFLSSKKLAKKTIVLALVKNIQYPIPGKNLKKNSTEKHFETLVESL